MNKTGEREKERRGEERRGEERRGKADKTVKFFIV